MRKKVTVLCIDQGAAFGGSLVVIANLVRRLDDELFRTIVVGEMDEGIIRHHVKGHADVFVIKHRFNYVHWQKFMNHVGGIRANWLRKLFLYAGSVVRRSVNIGYMVKLATLVLRERVDLIHINNGTDNVEANLVSLVCARKRLVHIHGVGSVGYLERRFLRHVPKVIAISEYVREEMVKEGIDRNKLVVIPNPVLPEPVVGNERAKVRESYGISGSTKLFGILGRIVPWKGQKEFLEAAQIVLGSVRDAKAIIIGDISDGAEGYVTGLHEFVAQQGMQDKVIFAGYVSDVHGIYAALDVVVHSSTAPEPFGLVITEAMAYGLPVVASTLGAPREIIDDGQDGFLIHPGETEKVAQAVIRLLEDDELRMSMGQRARQKVLATYDAQLYADRVGNLYKEVLAD